MFLSTLFLTAAIFAITSISAIGIAPALVIAAVGTTSLYGFFTTYNQISAKNILDSNQVPSDLVPATVPG